MRATGKDFGGTSVQGSGFSGEMHRKRDYVFVDQSVL